MSIDSRLWNYASDSIVSGVQRNQKELDNGLKFQSRVNTYIRACKTMALQGKVMRGGSEVEGEEALRHWNNLYTNLQNPISPSPEDESTSLAETLASQYLHLKQLTEEVMRSRHDPAWVENTIETVRSDAVSEREKAISNMFADIETLNNKRSPKLRRTSSKSEWTDDRSDYRKPRWIVSPRPASRPGFPFHGYNELSPQKNPAGPLAVSSTFKDEDPIGSIADSVYNIETATNKILFAHQQLGDTGEEQYGDLDRKILILDLELCDAENLYEAYEKALADEGREGSL